MRMIGYIAMLAHAFAKAPARGGDNAKARGGSREAKGRGGAESEGMRGKVLEGSVPRMNASWTVSSPADIPAEPPAAPAGRRRRRRMPARIRSKTVVCPGVGQGCQRGETRNFSACGRVERVGARLDGRRECQEQGDAQRVVQVGRVAPAPAPPPPSPPAAAVGMLPRPEVEQASPLAPRPSTPSPSATEPASESAAGARSALGESSEAVPLLPTRDATEAFLPLACEK